MIAAAPIARDYVVSTTYRKEEQAGLKWSRLRHERSASGEFGVALQSHGLEDVHRASEVDNNVVRASRILAAFPGPSMEKAGSITDIARGVRRAAESPPEMKLATILEHVALPLRWEPLNGATQHRGIPSGGGAFGAELFLIAPDHHGLACFRHISQDGALKQEGRSGAALSGVLGGADLAFVIVGNLASFLDPYGEFSPCLASLECGIMQAQLSLLCHACGWTAETQTRHDYRAVSDALQLGHWSRIPAVIVRVAGPGAREAAIRFRRETLSTSEIVPHVSGADDYPRMRDLIEAIVSEPVPARPADCIGAVGSLATGVTTGCAIDLLELVRRRTSGLDADMKQATGQIAMGDLTALAAEIALLHSLGGHTDFADLPLSLALLTVDQTGGKASPFALDLRDGRLSPAADPSKQCSNFTFTLAVDDIAEARRSGSRSFILNHIAAGALSQRICLAATAHGLFARPMRGYAEPTANMFLKLECRAILQVACGTRRQVNPAYDLRWW